MDWERIESARARARFMLAIPWFAIAFRRVCGDIPSGRPEPR